MEKELIRRLTKSDIDPNKSVLVKTHVPFIISGKYLDYKEGEMVSTTLEELYCASLASKYTEDYVKIYINDKQYLYKLDQLEIEKKDRGSLQAIVFGIFRLLIHRKYITVLEGLNISVQTNLTLNNGFPLNLLANILLSMNYLYNMNLKPSELADITQEVYLNYYGKTVSYLFCLTLYQDGINRYKMEKNTLQIEHLDKECNLFRYILFENGPKINLVDYNNYYSSLFELFAKVKKQLDINYLSDVDYGKHFGSLYSPYSELLEPEKLVFTHYIEENKRAEIIFSTYKNQNNPNQLLDAVKNSTNELGAYCGFNNMNKFLETSVYASTMKLPVAMTTLNDELVNMFVFVTQNIYFDAVMSKLAVYKNYFYYEVHPAKEAYTAMFISKEAVEEE